jgi:hypothetical protein
MRFLFGEYNLKSKSSYWFSEASYETLAWFLYRYFSCFGGLRWFNALFCPVWRFDDRGRAAFV